MSPAPNRQQRDGFLVAGVELQQDAAFAASALSVPHAAVPVPTQHAAAVYQSIQSSAPPTCWPKRSVMR